MKIFCKSGGFKGKTYTHLSGYGADGAVHHDSVRRSFTEKIFAAASDGVRRATKSVTPEERQNSGDSCGVGMLEVPCDAKREVHGNGASTRCLFGEYVADKDDAAVQDGKHRGFHCRCRTGNRPPSASAGDCRLEEMVNFFCGLVSIRPFRLFRRRRPWFCPMSEFLPVLPGMFLPVRTATG